MNNWIESNVKKNMKQIFCYYDSNKNKLLELKEFTTLM